MQKYQKNILIGLGIFALIVFLWLAIFAYKNLRGLGPVINRAPKNIEDKLPDNTTNTKDNKEEISTTTQDGLIIPDNLSIEVYAKDLTKPRDLILDPNGNLVVSETNSGEITLFLDKNGDGKVDEEKVLLSELDKPHGIEFLCEGNSCQMYIAETGGVNLYDYDKENLVASNGKRIIDLPAGGWHYTRTILINEDKLYISVGSSCNVCDEEDWRRAKVLVANLDGSDLKEYATGLRNAVFMNVEPKTQDIWVTEMGRDLLGDNTPPDEINILEEGDFGWPICYGKNIHDSEYDKNQYIRNPCEDKIPSYIDLQAHSAPLGLDFIPEEGWPEEWGNDMLVAYHGSWNRSVPTGYKIVKFNLDDERNLIGREDFIYGWLEGNTSWGRPVDILALPGGIMYVSDDKAGVIYRITIKQ